MRAVRGIYEDGRIELDERPTVRGRVPVVVAFLEEKAHPRARRRMRVQDHPAFGMWANRTDIGDTIEFAQALRRSVEERRDESPDR